MTTLRLWFVRLLTRLLASVDPQPLGVPAEVIAPVLQMIEARPLKGYPTLRARAAQVVNEQFAAPDPTAADDTRWHRAYGQLRKEFPEVTSRLLLLAMANALNGVR